MPPLKPALWIGVLLCLLATASVSAALDDLPFKGEDLKDNEKIYWARAIHGSGVQNYGYDLGAMRYDPSAKKWTELTVSDSAYTKRNDQWVIYGKPIYAVRAGRVIACWRNAPQNPTQGTFHPKIGADFSYIYGGGNGYWIEHSDGTKMEYAHMIPGSVPSALCPHNASLTPAKMKNPTVAEAWKHISVPAGTGAVIQRGQFLGRVGNAGTSGAPHLHIHLEKGNQPVQYYFARGMSAPVDNNDPHGKWTRFAGKPITPGPVLVWPPSTVRAEYARHGLPQGAFQALFDHLADSGYQPEWIDGYGVGGGAYYNTVWRPRKGAWRAYFGKTAAEYQSAFNQATQDGYVPTQVDTHRASGGARHSVIFEKRSVGWYARHNLTYAEHMAEMGKAKNWGMSPVSVSVVSDGAQWRYAVLYHKRNIGSWLVKSRLSPAEYQSHVTEQQGLGRKPVYLNSYIHAGKAYYSVIFAQWPGGPWQARHGLTASGYQSAWQYWLGSGFLTTVVSGMDGHTGHLFSAIWMKP